MIIVANYSPSWFLLYSIGLEVVFALVALAVSLLGLRVYRMVYQKEVKAISTAFLLISISYFIDALFNSINAMRLSSILSSARIASQAIVLNVINMYSHIILMILGFLILTLTIFKVRNKNISWLIFLLSLIAILTAGRVLLSFFLILTLYLLFISGYYLASYYRHKNFMTGSIALAFVTMLIASVFFINSVYHPIMYVWGHFLTLGAYLLLLLNFYLVLKK